MSFAHYNPVNVRFGKGVRGQLKGLCQGPTLLITGTNTLERSGCLDLLDEQIRRSIPVLPNPGDDQVNKLLQQAAEYRVTTIVGFGGGSTMDASKIVALLLGHCQSIAEYHQGVRIRERNVRLIQVPTTAGTGSEVTRWASLWNDGVKSSVDEVQGFADFALVDPELCHGAPPRLALATGLDALSHAMESLWGVHRTPVSEGYAQRALRLLVCHLERVISGHAQNEDYERLALASMLAGLALSCTRSAAAHALSYELTGRFGLEHGLGVGLLCRSLLQTNRPANPEGVASILDGMGLGSIAEAQKFIDGLFLSAGLEPKLSFFGIKREHFGEIVNQATGSNRLSNNPGDLGSEELLGALESIA